MDLSHKKLRLEIQTMHTTVIRARVQTCRKLINEIKKISQKKTADKLKQEKNTRKIERLTNEVHVLRHMKPNLIAKFCLSHTEESIEKLRIQPDVTPQLRALAKVSSHKLIKPLLDEFRKKFPKWQETLPKLLEKDLESIGITLSSSNKPADENHMTIKENNLEKGKDSDNEEHFSDNSRLTDSDDSDNSPKNNDSNVHSHKINAKANSKKVPPRFSLKFSPYKLKSNKKRQLSNSDSSDRVSDSDKRKSIPGNNVKNWLVEPVEDSSEIESEKSKDAEESSLEEFSAFHRTIQKDDTSFKEEKSILSNEKTKRNKEVVTPKNVKGKLSISHEEDAQKYSSLDGIKRKSKMQKTISNEVAQSGDEESHLSKTEQVEDSFFKRSTPKVDKSLEEEDSNLSGGKTEKNKEILTPKKLKGKKNSISLSEDDKSSNIDEINKLKILKPDSSEITKSLGEEESILSKNKEGEDSFFNRTTPKNDWSLEKKDSNLCAGKTEKNKDLVTPKNSKGKRSISHVENDKSNSKDESKKKSKIQKLENDGEEMNLNNLCSTNEKPYFKSEKKIETEQLQEDPFFITKDNNKYMTFGKIEEPKLEIGPLSSAKQSFPRSSLKVRNDRNYFTNTERFTNNKHGNKFQSKKLPSRDSRDRNVFNSEERKQQLHPSWEAKKRTSSLVPFQGKKICFDD